MKKSLILELQASTEFMSNTEKKIASVILSGPESFTLMSLGELESVAEVSQGSIINFSNKYAGGGFPALKMAVAASLASREETPLSIITGEDSAHTALKKGAMGISAAVQNTANINSGEGLEGLAELILKAKRIDIYGIYRSAIVASDLNMELLELGIPSSVVSDVLTCALSASLLHEGDLVIAISSSGKTRDILDAVKIAKENGAKVAVITAYKNSPLARLSDLLLIAASSGSSHFSFEKEIRMSQLALIDAVCAYIQHRIDKDGDKRYYTAKKILELHSERD
ncbi:MAG: MurR/RpiR family transcriptional regulator [Clostridia bacterium]|nr:MurR/RpiR family transcriptional regulator [Clostridia bacterium]